MIWTLLVWIAVGIGGVVAGAGWGLAGFDCDGGPGRIEIDGPCPVAQDPTLLQSASYVAAGAIRLGLAAISIGFVPGLAFAATEGAIEWVLGRIGAVQADRLAPWVALVLGAVASVVVVIQSEFAGAQWAWLGLLVPIGLVAIGIPRVDSPRSTFLSG